MRKLALALVVACGGHAATTTPPVAAASARVTPNPEAPVETDETRAESFIALLVKHDFPGAAGTFDDKMRAALPAARLASIWSALEAQAGPFVKVDSVDVTASGDVRVAVAKATFARAPLLLRVVLGKDDRVTGFFVAPGDTAHAWQPPPYAKPDSFEEQRVTVGSSPALPGTLALPKHATHYPVVVLVHGSGPNDADETLGALKVFKDLAWGLASRGVAVLRYDKRTRVDPTGVRTQQEEVDDAAHAAIALVRALPDIDASRIVLLGHSQGGYLAPRIAKDDASVTRLVILAGSARPLEDSLVSQLRYFASLHPDDEKAAEAVASAEKLKRRVESPSLKPDDVVDVLGVKIPGSYFLDVRGYRPERIAARLPIPILVLQGERDYQVTVADDFSRWRTALAHDKRATLRTYPGLSHAFVRGEGAPSPADYERPAHVEERVVDDIATWITSSTARTP